MNEREFLFWLKGFLKPTGAFTKEFQYKEALKEIKYELDKLFTPTITMKEIGGDDE